MGGLPGGPIDRTDHVLAPWEKRIDAMVRLLGAPQCKVIRVDEIRRTIEGFGAEDYDRLTYYERWVLAVANLLVEKGVITTEELGRKLDEVRARSEDRQ
jgi:hypothetical protein